MPGYRFMVLGRVQGVGFRAFVCGFGETMGLDGEVWNNRNGTVEILTTIGDEATLQAFSKGLKDGPGHVRDVVVRPSDVGELGPGFRIRFTR